MTITPPVGMLRREFPGRQDAWRIGLPFPGVDAAGAVDPLRVVNGVEPGLELGVAPRLIPDQKSLLIFSDCLDVLSVTMPRSPREAKPTGLESGCRSH